MAETTLKNIDKKYIDMMVEKFKAIPKDRKHTAERIKMILFEFKPWYISNRDKLTKEEREYLQANISRIDKDDKEEEEEKRHHPDIKEWWEE
jgi:hypothetical protein